MLLRDRRVTVRIYLPADYEWSDRDHRVVYMFDAHNLFDRTTSTYNKEWRIDEFMEGLAAQGDHEPAIVVGIDAPQNRYDRFAMYSIGQWDYRRRPDARRLKHIQGFGNETAAFLMRTVKGYVEKTYRASRDRDRIAVAGSSMGGYMALYVGATYSRQVSKVMAFSPVLMDFPMRGHLLRDVIVGAGAAAPQRIYADMGDRETLDFCGSRELVDHLEQVRLTLLEAGHAEILTRVVSGDRHDERAWARRFPGAYLWTFDGIEPD